MDFNKLCNEYSMAYQRILEIFKKTNKLKKVSYSIGSKRYCFAGYIENGILKVKLKKIYTDQKIIRGVATPRELRMSGN
jgi:hypothetical protein